MVNWRNSLLWTQPIILKIFGFLFFPLGPNCSWGIFKLEICWIIKAIRFKTTNDSLDILIWFMWNIVYMLRWFKVHILKFQICYDFWCNTKEIVERRHGEPIKFLFPPKMGLLGSQAVNEKNYWLWIMSNFWGLFFHVFMGKN